MPIRSCSSHTNFETPPAPGARPRTTRRACRLLRARRWACGGHYSEPFHVSLTDCDRGAPIRPRAVIQNDISSSFRSRQRTAPSRGTAIEPELLRTGQIARARTPAPDLSDRDGPDAAVRSLEYPPAYQLRPSRDVDLAGAQRPRADEAHVADEDVPRAAAVRPSPSRAAAADARDPRIVLRSPAPDRCASASGSSSGT